MSIYYTSPRPLPRGSAVSSCAPLLGQFVALFEVYFARKAETVAESRLRLYVSRFCLPFEKGNSACKARETAIYMRHFHFRAVNQNIKRLENYRIERHFGRDSTGIPDKLNLKKGREKRAKERRAKRTAFMRNAKRGSQRAQVWALE